MGWRVIIVVEGMEERMIIFVMIFFGDFKRESECIDVCLIVIRYFFFVCLF